MTTQTGTLASAEVQPIYLHSGAVSISGSVTAEYTASAGLNFLLCKLPKGAVVTDLKIMGGNGVTTMDFGVTEDTDVYLAAATVSPTYFVVGPTATAGQGYKTTTTTYLRATTGTVSTASANGVMRFSVTYHCDSLV